MLRWLAERAGNAGGGRSEGTQSSLLLSTHTFDGAKRAGHSHQQKVARFTLRPRARAGRPRDSRRDACATLTSRFVSAFIINSGLYDSDFVWQSYGRTETQLHRPDEAGGDAHAGESRGEIGRASCRERV